MTVLVDPDLPDRRLRQDIYHGDLVSSHQPAFGSRARRLHAGATRRALQTLRPRTCSRAHRQGGDGEAARFVEATLHPLLEVEGPGLQDHPRGGILCGGDPLRRPQASHLLSDWAPDHGYRVRVPLASRRLVQRTLRNRSIGGFPIFAVREDNAMRFDPWHFDRAVPNSSGEFDYYRINRARLQTASQISEERQARPAALNFTPTADLVIAPAPGGVMLFSGAQLHSSIPNTSGRARFSVDFRTVDVGDLNSGRGAPTVDVFCTGTSIRDFRRVADEAPFDENWVNRQFGVPPPGSMLVFEPSRDRAPARRTVNPSLSPAAPASTASPTRGGDDRPVQVGS